MSRDKLLGGGRSNLGGWMVKSMEGKSMMDK